ncbi:MAG: hypothetical protein U0263_14005 [Polyangiaceae bacterium]
MTSTAIHVVQRGVALIGGAALLLACAHRPESGRYCDSSGSGECVWVDIDREVVTFYQDGRPIDVPGAYRDGTISVQPQQGPFARKRVKLRFDPSHRGTLALEVSDGAPGVALASQLSYTLR